MQVEYRPVSSAARTTLNLSAPGFSVGVVGSAPGAGGGAPRPPAPYPYTPEKSGWPSGMRATVFWRLADTSDADAAGVVPRTTTVTVRLSELLLAPVTDNVYVVVTAGDSTCRPRGATRPIGSIVIDVGFSAAHVSVTFSPG